LPPDRTLAARLPHRDPSAARSFGVRHSPALAHLGFGFVVLSGTTAVVMVGAGTGDAAAGAVLGTLTTLAAGSGGLAITGNNSNQVTAIRPSIIAVKRRIRAPTAMAVELYHIVSAASQTR
jgi:hypothetical protein